MALPKISQSKTGVTLPSGKKLRIRPFIGSEEKAFLMAKQSNVKEDKINIAIDVLGACSDTDVRDLTMTDFEYLFMKAYEISVSQTIEVGLRCQNSECATPMDVSIPLNKIKVPNVDKKSEDIDVGKDEDGKNVRLIIRTPTVGESLNLTESDDPDVALFWGCLDGIYIEDEKCEIDSYEEFAEWFMAQKDLYRKCMAFVNGIPRVEFERKWKCLECKHENETVIKGFESFFS